MIRLLHSGRLCLRQHELSPALIANYCYDLAREFNQFYHDYSILGEEVKNIRNFRLRLSELTGKVLLEKISTCWVSKPLKECKTRLSYNYV